jgi:hypothetical protein
MKLTWHSVALSPGQGIEIRSDDGCWRIIFNPALGWTLYRYVDQLRWWGESTCLDTAMQDAQDTLDYENVVE